MVKIKEKERLKIIELYNKGYNLEKILNILEENGFKNTKNLLFSKIRSISELRDSLNKNRITIKDINEFKKEIQKSKKK
jgi:DNA-binding transcriptional MerR regulator